jgi:3-deoxy-7-phosphoheptulonate synthase
MCRAAIAAGADGILMEVHEDPARALCDGPQALRLNRIDPLMKQLNEIAKVLGRNL